LQRKGNRNEWISRNFATTQLLTPVRGVSTESNVIMSSWNDLFCYQAQCWHRKRYFQYDILFGWSTLKGKIIYGKTIVVDKNRDLKAFFVAVPFLLQN
jgi:hypothetical protein